VFPVKYEHNLHKKKKYVGNRPWRSIHVFPVRYQNHLHIERAGIFPNRPWRSIHVFPVRYDHHLHIQRVKLYPYRTWDLFLGEILSIRHGGEVSLTDRLLSTPQKLFSLFLVLIYIRGLVNFSM
jgi:hypothetical protein